MPKHQLQEAASVLILPLCHQKTSDLPDPSAAGQSAKVWQRQLEHSPALKKKKKNNWTVKIGQLKVNQFTSQVLKSVIRNWMYYL